MIEADAYCFAITTPAAVRPKDTITVELNGTNLTVTIVFEDKMPAGTVLMASFLKHRNQCLVFVGENYVYTGKIKRK